MNRRTFVVLVLAVVAGLAIVQYMLPAQIDASGPQPTVTQTTGILKQLREPGLFSSSSLRQATVTLADGTSIDASVIAGCVVNLDESVRVDVLSWNGVGEKVYVVTGAN
jgi:hypothetical protein